MDWSICAPFSEALAPYNIRCPVPVQTVRGRGMVTAWESTLVNTELLPPLPFSIDSEARNRYRRPQRWSQI